MNREIRARVAQESQEYIKNNSELFESYSTSLVDAETVSWESTGGTQGKIEVVAMTTYGALEQYSGEGKVGVLNFASARHPGGGFLKGAMAQEESLCYVSNLYNTLLSEPDFYNKPLDGGYYHNWMIVSRGVEFFKDENYFMRDKFLKCDVVITSPAVNCSSMENVGTSNPSKVNAVMLVRVRGILRQFAVEGCDTLILGAFGCGVFGNNPVNIGQIFRHCLLDENLLCEFKRVIFAIPVSRRDSNFSVFKRILG